MYVCKLFYIFTWISTSHNADLLFNNYNIIIIILNSPIFWKNVFFFNNTNFYLNIPPVFQVWKWRPKRAGKEIDLSRLQEVKTASLKVLNKSEIAYRNCFSNYPQNHNFIEKKLYDIKEPSNCIIWQEYRKSNFTKCCLDQIIDHKLKWSFKWETCFVPLVVIFTRYSSNQKLYFKVISNFHLVCVHHRQKIL